MNRMCCYQNQMIPVKVNRQMPLPVICLCVPNNNVALSMEGWDTVGIRPNAYQCLNGCWY